MKSSFKLSLVLGISLVTISTTKEANAFVIGKGDFSGSEIVIDFNSIDAFEGITNQFTGQGVTFSGSPFLGDPFPGSTINGTMNAVNFSDFGDINNPITAIFSTTINRVGMDIGGTVGGTANFTIQAFNGLNLVESQNFTALFSNVLPGGNISSVFAAFEVASGFDSIQISRIDGNLSLSLDDFRFESSSPEPIPTPALLPGLIGMGVAALRKRKQEVEAEA